MNSDLQQLARLNRLDDLRAALQSGADINSRDTFGATALHYSIAHKHADVARELIARGADVTIRDGEGKTALHSAIEHNLYGVAEAIVKADPAVIAVADAHGNEPLWTAAFNARGKYDLVQLLLGHGADVNHVNNVGLRPIDIPVRTGDRELLEILQSAGET